MSSPTLQPWIPNIKRGVQFSALIFGSRRSGKSYYIKHIIENYLKFKYQAIIVFTNTMSSNYYQDFLYPLMKYDIAIQIYPDYDPMIIDKLKTLQEARLAKSEKMYNILIIFDDCSTSNERNESNLKKLFSMGRHPPFNMSIIFSTQDPKFADTSWTNNSDYVMIFRFHSAYGVKRIKEIFLDNVITEQDIEKSGKTSRILSSEILHYAWKDFGALVVDYSEPITDETAISYTNSLYMTRACKTDIPRKKKAIPLKEPCVLSDSESGDEAGPAKK